MLRSVEIHTEMYQKIVVYSIVTREHVECAIFLNYIFNFMQKLKRVPNQTENGLESAMTVNLR